MLVVWECALRGPNRRDLDEVFDEWCEFIKEKTDGRTVALALRSVMSATESRRSSPERSDRTVTAE